MTNLNGKNIGYHINFEDLNWLAISIDRYLVNQFTFINLKLFASSLVSVIQPTSN